MAKKKQPEKAAKKPATSPAKKGGRSAASKLKVPFADAIATNTRSTMLPGVNELPVDIPPAPALSMCWDNSEHQLALDDLEKEWDGVSFNASATENQSSNSAENSYFASLGGVN